MAAIKIIRVQRDSFDSLQESKVLTEGRRDLGALVTFTGLCRDEGGLLTHLEIEHYPGMAESEIARVAHLAETRWQLEGLLVIHRYGPIAAGEPIVFVAAASLHRSEAFAAAAFMMDFLKTNAPFWKKEIAREGSSAEWIAAKTEDEIAAARWDDISPTAI
jgi:molybdopterin synthase catalytic subunit